MARESIREFGVGTVIFREGEEGDLMYVLLDGAVEIRKRKEGNEFSLETIEKPSDFFGEMALIDGKPRSASAVAVKPSRLMAVDQQTFENMLLTNGSFALQIVRSLSRRLRSSRACPDGAPPVQDGGSASVHPGPAGTHSPPPPPPADGEAGGRRPGTDPKKNRVRKAIAAASDRGPVDAAGNRRLPVSRLRKWLEGSLGIAPALVDAVLEEDCAGGGLAFQTSPEDSRGILVVSPGFQEGYGTGR